jgi:hypothetical protein
VWAVTFNDAGDDFDLAVESSDIGGQGIAAGGGATTVKVQSGTTHGPCYGALKVPTLGGLVPGQLYASRVFAVNRIGFSAAQTAPEPVKPCTVPGLPTGVNLSNRGQNELRVVFYPPNDDGGDTVTSYSIEMSKLANFSRIDASGNVTLLSAGAPFYRVMTQLDNGVDYYARARACNSQGCGDPQTSVPSYLAPHTEPGTPVNAVLAVTSDSMLTIGWETPLDDGGSAILGYEVEWDTVATVGSSMSAPPDKGTVLLPETARSYTMQYLSQMPYYASVRARNAAGSGPGALTSPLSQTPGFAVPGAPSMLALHNASGSLVGGTFDVTWAAPIFPHHGMACGGNQTRPRLCPTPPGGTTPESTGGAPVTAYRVEWSASSIFAATEADSGFAIVVGSAYGVRNATRGARYYVRVAATSMMGSSAYCAQLGTFCRGGPASVRASTLGAN